MASTIYDKYSNMKKWLKDHPFIVSIVLIGGILRLSGLFWGMPINSYQYNYHPDEWTYLLALYGYPLHIVFQKFLPYPMFIPYAINILTPFNSFFATITNTVNLILSGNFSEVHFLWTYFKFLGRFITVIMGTSSIAITYVISKKMYGKIAGLSSAIFIALALYAVQNSTFFTPAVHSSFFMLLLILVGLYLREKPSLATYGLTALATATLAATMYPAFVGIVFALIIHTEVAFKKESTWSGRFKFVFGSRLWFYAGIAFATFLILSPGIIFHFKAAYLSITEELWRATTALPKSKWDFHSWFELALRSVELLGPWLALLTFLALIWNLVKIDFKTFPLIVPPILSWMIFVNAMRPRHMVLLIPFYAIWVGRLLQDTKDSRFKLPKIVIGLLFTISVSYSLFYNIKIITSRYNDNRYAAAKYIEENIEPNATVGIKCLEGKTKAYDHKHFHEFMWDFPYFPKDRYKLTDCLKDPKYIILSEYTNKYPLAAIDSGHLEDDVWPTNKLGLWWREKIPPQDLMRLYRELLTNNSNDYKLIKRFESSNFEKNKFKIHYELANKVNVDWPLISKVYFNPNTFFAFEYASPEISIYKKIGCGCGGE